MLSLVVYSLRSNPSPFPTHQQAGANALTNAIKGDSLQAIATSGANIDVKQFVGENSCWPSDADELTDAIENQDCELVVLSNGEEDAYALEEAIMVTRYVRVMGSPAVLPVISSDGERDFTVGPGGFLELQFVRLHQGGGTTRPRYGLEGLELNTQVAEIRGGGVAVEVGALGASFVGVIFIAVANDLESVQGAIESTLDFIGGRIYGGHVFVAAGTVTFFGCNFWDTTLLLPLTDQISIGGDVLVVAGNAFFTGCTFTATLLFGNFGGAGFNVAVLGGNAVFTFCVIQAQGVAQSANGAGQVLFVGGGTMIVTGMDFRFASPILFFSGIGDFFVGGGVMIFAGVTIENTYPILAAYGAGFYLAVGGGVMVETGVTYVQYSGPATISMTGGSTFMGAGTSVHTGVPASFYGTTVLFTGQGGFSYNGAGYSLWLGSPIAIFVAASAFFGLGGLVSQPAGFMVSLGCPAFTPAALSYFAGAGAVMYLGVGGAVIGSSPVVAPAYRFGYIGAGDGANYYVNGNGNAAGKGIGYYDKHTTSQYIPEDKGKTKADNALAGKGIGYFDKYTTTQYVPEDKTKGTKARKRELFDGEVRKLKQQRRLSVSTVNQLAANFFDEDLVGPNRILGVGLEVNPTLDLSNNKVIQDLQKWVPQGIIDGAKAIEDLNGKFGDSANNQRGALMGIDSDVTQCDICGKGEIVGDEASQCTMHESCTELQAATVGEGVDAAFDFQDFSFDPWYLVMATFNPTTAEGTIAPEDFRDAFRSYFVAADTVGASVSAYSAEPDALFQQWFPKPNPSALASSQYPVTTPLKTVFVFNDPAQAAAVEAALKDPTSEMYQDMEAYVTDFLGMDDVDMGNLDGSLEKVVAIPAYNTPEFSKAFAKEASDAAGTNSIRLVDGEHAGMPLFHAVAGETYTVKLANFPKNIELGVSLIGSQLVGGEAKQTSMAIDSIKTDKDGHASVAWKVPATAAGDFYLKAADASGLAFGMTPMFEVVAAPKRKLWGPHMNL